MSYRIMYSPEDNHKYPPHKQENKWILPSLLVIALLVVAARPQVRNAVEEWLIPGDTHVTKAAFAVMLDEIKSGEPVGEAVTTFCNMIIDNGKSEEILDT